MFLDYPALLLVIAYLNNIVVGTDRIEGLIALQVILGLIYFCKLITFPLIDNAKYYEGRYYYDF